ANGLIPFHLVSVLRNTFNEIRHSSVRDIFMKPLKRRPMVLHDDIRSSDLAVKAINSKHLSLGTQRAHGTGKHHGRAPTVAAYLDQSQRGRALQSDLCGG